MIQSPFFWLFLITTWLLATCFQRIRHQLMCLASIAYLGWLAPDSVLALLAWVTLAMILTRLPERFRFRFASLIILASLGALAYYKYVPPILSQLTNVGTTEKILIPLGISFYTFKLIHFCVEFVKGNLDDCNSTNVLLYFFWFPIFTAGPIERFDHLVQNSHAPSRADLVWGLNRIVYGLVKKFVLCEIALRWLQGSLTPDNLFVYLDETSTPRLWFFLGVFYLLTYLDFSAYSDIAIGSSRLFGLRIMENFNFPVIATSIGDFWRRWHMTLSKWCQSYVYMPVLGKTRRPYLATYCSFIVFGLWHAGTLTRLNWGIYHATGITVFALWNRYKRQNRIAWTNNTWWRALSYVFTQAFVIAGMATLVGEEAGVSFSESLNLLRRLFQAH